MLTVRSHETCEPTQVNEQEGALDKRRLNREVMGIFGAGLFRRGSCSNQGGETRIRRREAQHRHYEPVLGFSRNNVIGLVMRPIRYVSRRESAYR